MPGRSFSSSAFRYGYQGSEKDDEITSSQQSHFTTHFREGDTRLGRWWSIDPIINAWESPYTSMACNPIKFNDYFGDKVDIDATITSDKTSSDAMKQFISTKQGVKFLSKYAAAGQIIMGHKFEKDGKFHTKGIDLKYVSGDIPDGADGQTSNAIINNRLQIKIQIGSPTATAGINSVVWLKTKTLFHESLIHAEFDTKDYIDDKKMNHSNISKRVKDELRPDGWGNSYESHWHHRQATYDFYANEYNNNWSSPNPNSAWPYDAYLGMKQVSINLKVKVTDNQIKSILWSFQGGIHLDPKTGMYKK